MINYLHYVKLPFTIVVIYILVIVLMYVGIIPSSSVLENEILNFYNNYGLYAVGFLSFIENIPLVNAYFPGSIVILISMSLTNGNLALAFQTYLVIYLLAFVAYNISFFIGKYFSSNQSLKSKQSSILMIYFLSFWHPHSASLACLSSGSEGISYKIFFINMLIISFIWNTFWAVLMYNINLLEILKQDGYLVNTLILVYLLLWLGYKSLKYLKEQK